MGSALYISIKDEIPDVDPFMNGKALAKAWEALDTVAAEIDVTPITKLCNSAWKNPANGLDVFRKYLIHVKEHPETVPNAESVIDDLAQIVFVLEACVANHVKWRLLVDY